MKEYIRDYITAMYRFYAAHKQTSGRTMSAAEKADIKAVACTLRQLEEKDRGYIVAAISAVYFVAPAKMLKRGDITSRVRRFSIDYGADERTVYRWLRYARALCAINRGLRCAAPGEKHLKKVSVTKDNDCI